MCAACMDQSTNRIVEETGIDPRSMDLVDELVIDAIEVGERLNSGEKKIEGDPLFARKRALAGYVASLEKAYRLAECAGMKFPLDAVVPVGGALFQAPQGEAN